MDSCIKSPVRLFTSIQDHNTPECLYKALRLKKEGKEIIFTDIEYRILVLLASHKQRIYSAQMIYELIWNEPFTYSSNNTVTVHIRNIRRKLGDDPQNCQTIRTVWGKGYRIE